MAPPLRGASVDTYATMDEHDDDCPHVELYLDPGVREAFTSIRGARVHESAMPSLPLGLPS